MENKCVCGGGGGKGGLAKDHTFSVFFGTLPLEDWFVLCVEVYKSQNKLWWVSRTASGNRYVYRVYTESHWQPSVSLIWTRWLSPWSRAISCGGPEQQLLAAWIGTVMEIGEAQLFNGGQWGSTHLVKLTIPIYLRTLRHLEALWQKNWIFFPEWL